MTPIQQLEQAIEAAKIQLCSDSRFATAKTLDEAWQHAGPLVLAAPELRIVLSVIAPGLCIADKTGQNDCLHCMVKALLAKAQPTTAKDV